MKVVALVQARMGFTRLPNKVMRTIIGTPMIELLLSGLSQAREVNQIVVATSTDARNQPMVAHVQNLGYACESGSENDVLDRFVKAAENQLTPLVASLSFVASDPRVSRMVVGVDSLAQLNQIIRAVDGPMKTDFPAELASADPELIKPSSWSKQ